MQYDQDKAPNGLLTKIQININDDCSDENIIKFQNTFKLVFNISIDEFYNYDYESKFQNTFSSNVNLAINL